MKSAVTERRIKPAGNVLHPPFDEPGLLSSDEEILISFVVSDSDAADFTMKFTLAV